MTRLADRLQEIQPFHVMDILARAKKMEADGRSVIHMEIGEPDFPTPDKIVQAGIKALESGNTHYTPALGLPALREAINQHYEADHQPGSGRIVITPGASGALQLAFGALINPGDEVLLADPGYPCNRHFVRMFEGRAVSIPVGPEQGFQLSADLVRQHWTEKTVAVLVASPSNPTGTVVADSEMEAITQTVAELGGMLIVDEIYHGLTYGSRQNAPGSALCYSPNTFIVNSFSKYYGMTGWRVGWLVAPTDTIDVVERLAQNIFIAAATPAQYAALAAFDDDVTNELNRRRDIFCERRDFLLPALRDLGFSIPIAPQGAFYLYADCSCFSDNAYKFVVEVLEKTAASAEPVRPFRAALQTKIKAGEAALIAEIKRAS
ncbi:MAG: aminotransferase class I/II-fold pyridoxal phosphate-dependent enzyme, partial [Halocynthiibacter sp.]